MKHTMHSANYIEILFKEITAEELALLTALLSDFGFEGFEEDKDNLKAYIIESKFDKPGFIKLMQKHRLPYHQQVIESRNWNAVWEESFEPVIVADFVAIRAHFHKAMDSQVQHELIITPKMSFGTGHHATTYMMILQMQALNFAGKRVFDFGTGTGVLAILAEKLGAAVITAIDIDSWSIENAAENIQQNNCTAICLYQADGINTDKKFDVVLANINKDVIVENIYQLVNCLNIKGSLILSGLLTADEPCIMSKAVAAQLKYVNTIHKDHWIAMQFTR